MKSLQKTVNMSVLQTNESEDPGVFLNGDSLYSLYVSAMELLSKLEGTVSREQFLLALSHTEVIEIYLNNYERALKKNEMPLPYKRNKDLKTKLYEHYWDGENI